MTTIGESVRIVKLIGAPIDRVYEAFIDPDELVRWMSPDDYRGHTASNDPRVGGRGDLTHTGRDGGEVIGGFVWEYIEVEPNRKLVMDWQFQGCEVDPDAPRSRMTIELRAPDASSTEVTLTHDRLGEAPPGGHVGVNTGWTQALESLQRHFGSHEGAQ